MKKKKVMISCDTCVWNDCGLCDRLGWFVDPDDKCEKWERVSHNEENYNADYQTAST